ETGLDYMLARYYPASMGRFLSVDPGTDIRPEDPQSWNLYGYVRNNQVNATDPDGKEVPESCAENRSCSITVKVNVVWDSAAKLTAQQMQDFPKTQLDKAITDFENSNIKLDVKCTQGRIVRNDAGDVSGVNGLDKGALNVVVSNTTPRPDVVGLAVVSQGYALAFVNALQVHTWNIWAWSGNTTEHEMGHHFEGDMSMKRTIFSNLFTDTVLNARLANQGGGFSVGAFRMGLIPAWFAFETSEQR
ncbi:MAG: RHS repeat-associated core domain-containing protein, partial [Candidatus Polarisedimenticolia bacterium]